MCRTAASFTAATVCDGGNILIIILLQGAAGLGGEPGRDEAEESQQGGGARDGRAARAHTGWAEGSLRVVVRVLCILHSEILSRKNCHAILDLLPRLEDNHTLKCSCNNFS